MSEVPHCDDELDGERTVLRKAGGTLADLADELSEHSLVVLRGSEAGRRLRLGATPAVIGRRAPADWILFDLEISARHCEVSGDPRRADASVTDLGSTNGTFVNGTRVTGPAPLPNGALLKIGDHVLKHEYRPWSDTESSDRLERDLVRARQYIEVLLPAPVREGPVRTESFFMPSAKLGGDAFGHQQLDERSFCAYLVDVSGHGVGAAMHGVSIMNALRQGALPARLHDPADVLRALNDLFQMESHAGMYFSIWYGVFDLVTRTLSYASAGHHPAYLAAGGRLLPLQTPHLVIGARPGLQFRAASVDVPAGASLYVFSDGMFEIVDVDGRQWGLGDFLPLLEAAPAAAQNETERLYKAIRKAARPGPLEDDVSLLVVTFL